MNIHQLPDRIVRVMVGTILIFVLALTGTVVWLTHALDKQAHDNSVAQVRVSMANFLAKANAMNLDYAKWDEAASHVSKSDTQWLFDAIGVAASIGEALQSVVIWGGPYESDIGWLDDGIVEPRSGLLQDEIITEIERRLQEVPVGTYSGIRPFFAWNDGSLYAIAASRIEMGLNTSGPPQEDRELARLAQGHRFSEEQIQAIAHSTLLSGVDVSAQIPAGADSLPLAGLSGEPVAYVSWSPPKPGTTLLYKILPFLLGVIVLATLMLFRGLAMVRRNAQHLVAAEREASFAARTDALTGLPNRLVFSELLSRSARAQERAVLFLDINDFKRINDSAGHAAGDAVIVSVAKRLAQLATHDCVLARIAGDEFVFVLMGDKAECCVEELADQATALMTPHFQVLGRQVQVELAMGYAVQSDDLTTGDDLVRQADLAMYEAKRHKAPGPVAFNALIRQAALDALAIEKGLRRALVCSGQISVAYQPIVDWTGKPVRAEALARWTSPELGSVPPDRFIVVAEQAGLIVDLGRLLLRLVCDDLVTYPELRVGINVSPLQLMAPDYIPNLMGELREHAIDPSRIEIELTESVLVDDPRLASERLAELRAAGFSIALDDFGTGYSSVGYLGRFQFDTLKIDRSFVSKIRSSMHGVAVVDGMIRMAHGYELKVVCEGIESSEEFATLRELGCDFGQGYHIGPPVQVHVLAAQLSGQAFREAKVA